MSEKLANVAPPPIETGVEAASWNDAETAIEAADEELAEVAAAGLAKVIGAERVADGEIPEGLAGAETIEIADTEETEEPDDEEGGWDSSEVEEYEPDENERWEYSSAERSFEILPLSAEIRERYPFLDSLPKNIAVMGGMARSIAREMITGDREPIRDIDLVNILDSDGESFNDDETLDRLAREYMADDYRYGHGIGDDYLERYFDTRDFTVNESLIMNGALIVSNFAYDDLQENIIRPTYHEMSRSDYWPRSRLALRGLMMQAVLEECTSSYPTIEDMEIDEKYIYSFDVAVNLNKAMSRGAETARKFTDLLADYEIIPAELGGRPKATARYLRKYKVQDFEFRMNDDQRVSKNQHHANRIDYYASDPEMRAAMSEYEDNLDAERFEGQYTREEFDDINRQKFDFSQLNEGDDYYYEDEWEEE